jgi:hypothetical protein
MNEEKRYDVYWRSDANVVAPDKYPNEYYRIASCLSKEEAQKFKRENPDRDPHIFPMQPLNVYFLIRQADGKWKPRGGK